MSDVINLNGSYRSSHGRTIGQDAEKAFWYGNERLWYEGDHMRFWNGSLPEADDPDRSVKLRLWEKLFFSYNIIEECVNRTASALAAKPFSFSIVDGEGRVVEAEKPTQDLNAWLTLVSQFSNSQNADWGSPWYDSVLNALIDGRGILRVWTPARFQLAEEIKQKLALHSPRCASVETELDKDGLLSSIDYVSGNTTETHFHWLYSEEDIPEDAIIFDEQELLGALGIAEAYQQLLSSYSEGLDDDETPDIPSPAIVIKQQIAPGTLVVKIAEGEDEDKAIYMVYPELKGKWLIHTISTPTLITESVKRCQASCNLALTSLNLNLDKSGNRIRWLLNALRPGRFEADPASPGQQRFVESNEGINVSPFNVNFVGGIPYGDQSRPSITTPSLFLEDPVSVELFESTINLFRTIMYDMFGQGFIRSSGDGSISGVSRVQIKSDFAIATQKIKEVAESAFGGILTSVLRLLSPEYEDYQVFVSLKVWMGALLPEEQEEIRNQFKDGLLSRGSAITKLGQSDNAMAEIEAIESDPSHIFEKAKALLENQAITKGTALVLSQVLDEAAAMAEAEKMKQEEEEQMERTAKLISREPGGDGGTIDTDG